MRWSDIPRNPTRSTLRQFGLICLVFFGGMAAWRWVTTHTLSPFVVLLAVLAIALGLLGLLRPAWLRTVFVGWMIAAFPIGWVVSHIVLALMYYGVVMPVALTFRLMGRDALAIRRPDSATYWRPKPSPGDVRRYFKQY